ncbi:MAG: S41 family peptidase [Acidobacteriota bacterium]
MAALVGGWLGDKVSAGAPLEEDTQQLLKTFTQTLSVVESKYAREIATEELVENAVRGMLRTLDPHSSYFTRSDYNRLQEEQQGRYYGLGISIRAESPGSGRVVILEPPAPGTPAYKVGLKVGDVISKIKGEPIEDWDLNEEVIPNLKGPKGTTVDITIERPGVPEPIELTVERDEIPIYTIKYSFMIRPGIGYIAIDRFSETTGGELDEALRNLNESGLGGLILDLRNNPGGALSQAIAVSDRFLEKDQIIVSTRSRSGKDQEYKAPKGRQHTYPMVVLINESSASASEIVAGALQDHDRALIVGETSFGKALVQTIYPLHGNRGLALTTGKYYTPSDRLIQRDYAGSFYDYLYTRRSTSDAGSGEHHTDSGRAVYSGGGISPDVRVQLEPNSKLGRMIDRENLFWNFVSKLSTGGIKSDVNYDYSGQELSVEQRKQLTTEIEISENTLNLFKDYLRENKIAFSDEDFEESEELVENRLKQQLFLKLFGDKEGYKVALEIDRQVQEALGVLPRAQVLLQNSLARK